MTRALRGAMNHQSGLAAEAIVVRSYLAQGRTLAGQRWRGQVGEIDLIFREGDRVVFTEVKKSKTHDMAALRLSHRQMKRLRQTASEFLDGEPRGQLTEMRFDLATVDQAGTVRIIENAVMEA